MTPWDWTVIVILLQVVESKVGSQTWPHGHYTLLKPRTGCPDGWHDKGYLYQDTIDKNPSNNRSETLHIDGRVACSHVKRYFCSKTNEHGVLWPSGQYCVYRHKNENIHRMKSGSILMYGENNNNEDKYRSTKFLVNIKKSGFLWNTYQYMRLYFACHIRRGSKKIPISLPITKPFYLLPYGSRDCQQVKWMAATLEWIRYHTRNYITKSAKQKYGTVPYHELGDSKHKGITMYYCYYKSCNSTLNSTKGVFQSPGFPGQYPDGQLCSWRIMVPENHTLHVRFTNFSLDDKDTLRYVRSINGSLRTWYTIRLPSVPLSSDSDVLFVFRSDESKTSAGFRAEYRVSVPQVTTAPTDLPTFDVTLSTTSTTPSSERNTFSSKPSSSISSKSVTSPETSSTLEPAPQHSKSNAEALRSSSLSSRDKAIIVIVVPSVCLLIAVVLLILVIYQCRYRKTRRGAKNSKRGAEETDRTVMNPTYDRGAVLLNSPNETATDNSAFNGSNNSCVTTEYENVEREKSSKAHARQNPKISDSAKESDHVPLYHVSELQEPKARECLSQLERRKPEAIKDSDDPNPLYHVLEEPYPTNDLPEKKPDEDQTNLKSREGEVFMDSGPNPLYHVLEGPYPNNDLLEKGPDEDQSNSRPKEAEVAKDSGPNPLYHVLEGPYPNTHLPERGPDEDQSNSRPKEGEVVVDSGPNPLYHVLEGPNSDKVEMASAPTYEDVD